MKKSRLSLLGSGILIAIMAIGGQHAFAKAKFSTKWYQSRTTGWTSFSTTDCDGHNEQCTILTNTVSGQQPVDHPVYNSKNINDPALHA